MRKINEKDLGWEPATHEDPENPGVWKKIVVKHEDVDPRSKLMMVNYCKVPVGKTHAAHSHETMEEIFYFTSGEGQVKINDEIEDVTAGDRVIVGAKGIHQIKNTGKVDL
ncbi:MAG TPA: cupin domain-containing protein, partial [Candidatus Saccharimonadales bacterium]|nr:cupin domain-containing protein [Candidatus Saccharimonadales bacterium]